MKSSSFPMKQLEHAHSHTVEKYKPLITLKAITANLGAKGKTKCDQIVFQTGQGDKTSSKILHV